MRFEWDPVKAAVNLKKHGVSFIEGATVFRDLSATIIDDPDHSLIERREIIIGFSTEKRVLFVSFTQRGDVIRIISARRANRKERLDYEEYKIG